MLLPASAPPLAGLCSYPDAASADGSVEDAVRFLRRLARIERRTLLVLAAHLNAVPEWEVKCGFSLHIWQDAEHYAWLRQRLAELRKPSHHLDRPDDTALEAFFEELIRSRTTHEVLTGVYAVLKPNVIADVEHYIERANPLAEQPTLRLLRFFLLEEREQLAWGVRALEAHGGVDAEWEPDEVSWRMLYVRLTEMHVPELLRDQALERADWWDEFYAGVVATRR